MFFCASDLTLDYDGFSVWGDLSRNIIQITPFSLPFSFSLPFFRFWYEYAEAFLIFIIFHSDQLCHFLCQTANVFDVFDSNRLYSCQEKIDLELLEIYIFAVRGTCACERFSRRAFRNDRFEAGISSATKGIGSIDRRKLRSCGPKGKNDSGNAENIVAEGATKSEFVVRSSLRVCTHARTSSGVPYIPRRFTTKPIGSRCNRSE